MNLDDYNVAISEAAAREDWWQLSYLSVQIRRCCWQWHAKERARELASLAETLAKDVSANDYVGPQPRFPAYYQAGFYGPAIQ